MATGAWREGDARDGAQGEGWTPSPWSPVRASACRPPLPVFLFSLSSSLVIFSPLSIPSFCHFLLFSWISQYFFSSFCLFLSSSTLTSSLTFFSLVPRVITCFFSISFSLFFFLSRLLFIIFPFLSSFPSLSPSLSFLFSLVFSFFFPPFSRPFSLPLSPSLPSLLSHFLLTPFVPSLFPRPPLPPAAFLRVVYSSVLTPGVVCLLLGRGGSGVFVIRVATSSIIT